MSEESNDWRVENVRKMGDTSGFDVLIVCTSSRGQAKYWQERLETNPSISSNKTTVLTVFEDWKGESGAGNALGTLYAWQNACQKSSNTNIQEQLSEEKISVAIYHTAGKGTRLAPLPGSEVNNKPGVKLPATVELGDKKEARCLTILEAVIKQTSIYSESRKGRLSVFWGDQIFIPSINAEYKPACHIDVLCKLQPMPSKAQWNEKGMNKYGLIAVSDTGTAQIEKAEFEEANDLLKKLGKLKEVGISLGSFSISSELLDVLLKEFKPELRAKNGKMDSDPDIWMPLTLPKESFLALRKKKGFNEETSAQHFERISKLKSSLSGDIFCGVDIGSDAYWWDYGQLHLYLQNCLLLTKPLPESKLMSLFFGHKSGKAFNGEKFAGNVFCDCEIFGKTVVKDSVLASVRCVDVNADGAILINVTSAANISAGKGSIVYNVVSESDVCVEAGEVLVGVANSEGLLRCSIEGNMGALWEEMFEKVYNDNKGIDMATFERERLLASSVVLERLRSSGMAKNAP
eukprot:CAMPEP_0171453094 /NCGR_PEP_ID=MMETSP0945-20130129/944_1 /TAXON_ID=109269 /ORGANISM="Vaucheria litorea, Strain CCMP2940" /LENGTH=517 /DNA_ID=CAMNT_0011977901 /DNA_START=163 /DNA_END=1712 /DNA_ORIENTATION=-